MNIVYRCCGKLHATCTIDSNNFHYGPHNC
jgi:hypothetical protein